MALLQGIRTFQSRHNQRIAQREKEEKRDWRRDMRHMRQWIYLLFTTTATVIGLSFIGMGYFIAANRAIDVTQFEKLQTDIKTERAAFEKSLTDKIEGNVSNSKLVFLGDKGQPLSVLHGEITRDDNKPSNTSAYVCKMIFYVRNTGGSPSGEMWFTIFLPKEFKTDRPSSAENEDITMKTQLPYEVEVGPKDLHIDSIPGGGYTLRHEFSFAFSASPFPKKGVYQGRIEVFYGKGQSSSADVKIFVDQSAPVPIAKTVSASLSIPPIGIHDPGSSIPTALAQFSGIWLGKRGKLQEAVAVKRIKSDGSADVEYWRQLIQDGEYVKADVSSAKIVNDAIMIDFTDDQNQKDRMYLEIYGNNPSSARVNFWRSNDNNPDIGMDFAKQ
jgi:hypothetical protein